MRWVLKFVHGEVEGKILFLVRKCILLGFKVQIIISYSRILSIDDGYPGSLFSSILFLPVFERTPAAQMRIHPIFLPVKT